MNNLNKLVKLKSMRVQRTYTGGKLLNQLQHIHPAIDGTRPEEWIASTIKARYDQDPYAGLSVIQDGPEEFVYLKDYIEAHPVSLLGSAHVEKFGSSMGFLAKLIDSNIRLNIQTHPDDLKAKEYFNSSFGKTESWYIVDTRTIEGEDPYILLGFKPGITKEKWITWIEKQDIEAIKNSLHKIVVHKDDVFMVESGMPHAIGPGCFLAEVQEPTDFTLRIEKMMNGDTPYPDEVYHQGIGYEKMYACFDYQSYSLQELLAKVKIPSSIISESNEHYLVELLGANHSSRFGMKKLVVKSSYTLHQQHTFSTAIILAGKGSLSCGFETIRLEQSDELFIPVVSDSLIWNSTDQEPLEVLMFYPPLL